jgi:hypothetical protein
VAADDNERRPLFAGEGDETVCRVAGLDRRSWTAVGRDAVDGFSQQSGGSGNLFFAGAWLHDVDEYERQSKTLGEHMRDARCAGSTGRVIDAADDGSGHVKDPPLLPISLSIAAPAQIRYRCAASSPRGRDLIRSPVVRTLGAA